MAARAASGRVRRARRGGLGSRPNPDYVGIVDALPLLGPRPSTVFVALLEAAGFAAVDVQSLLDPHLWGEVVTRDRYLVTGTRPEA